MSTPVSDPHTTPRPALTPGSFTMKVLNGISIAVVVSLVPQALLGELAKALLPYWSGASTVLALTGLASSLLPVMIGVLVGIEFKMTPIQTAAVGIASFCGSGVATVNPEGGFFLKGTGLVISSGLTAAIAVALLLVIGNRLKSYSILLLSTIVTLVAGSIGWGRHVPRCQETNHLVGRLSQRRNQSAAHRHGRGIGLALRRYDCLPHFHCRHRHRHLHGRRSIRHCQPRHCGRELRAPVRRLAGQWFRRVHPACLGLPKVQMANMLSRPVTFLPVVCSAAIVGGIGGALGISGTALSAGFGISGLMGSLAALNYEGWGWTAGNVTIIAIIYIAVPLALGLFFGWLFEHVFRLTKPEYYALNFE